MHELASSAHRQVQRQTNDSVGRPGDTFRSNRPLLTLLTLSFIVGVAIKLTALPEWVGPLPAAGLAGLASSTHCPVGVTQSRSTIRAALEAVNEEQDQVEAEQEAFAEFAEEVRSLSPAGRSAEVTDAQTVNGPSGNRRLARVRDAYRETVMSTPDFEREYDESLREHVAAEFGDDFASLLSDGHQLNQHSKQLIARQARHSAQHRQLLLEGLAVENRSLEHAASTLEPVFTTLTDVTRGDVSVMSLPRLIDLDCELCEQRENCLALLRTRQEQIHTVNRRVKGDSKTLTQEYLYCDLPVRFPALCATLECLESIRTARSTLVDAVCAVH